MKLQAELTDRQVKCLFRCVTSGLINPWDFGSTTIAVLKRRGMIAKPAGCSGYVVTDAGLREYMRLMNLPVATNERTA